MVHQLPLRLLFTECCSIDVCPLAFVAREKLFFMHDLHELQYCSVTSLPLLIQGFLNLTYRCCLQPPEHSQNGQFGICWLGSGSIFHFVALLSRGNKAVCTRRVSYLSTNIFVDREINQTGEKGRWLVPHFFDLTSIISLMI